MPSSLPGHRLIHRAMLCLLVAMGLTRAAWDNPDFAWFYLLALPCWIAGIRYIVLGSRQLRNEQRDKKRR